MYLIIFVTIAITLILILVGIVIFLNISVYSIKKDEETVILAGNCQIDFNKHPEVSSLPCCVDIYGNLTQNKFLESKNMIISPNPVPYFNVCSGYCSLGIDPNDNTKCLGDLGNSDLNNCLNELKPSNCTGEVNPVAYSGGVKYYAYSIGESLCKIKNECVIRN